MPDDRYEAAKESLCIWLMLVIALALFCMFGAACPVYGQAPLTDAPVYPFGWGVRITGTDPVDVTIGTAKNLYGVAAVIDRYGRVRQPAIPCQWTVAGWPIHPTSGERFTAYLVRVRGSAPMPTCDPTATPRDVFALINFLFANGERPELADVNGDGNVNGADVVRLIDCVYGDARWRVTGQTVTASQRVAAVAVPYGPCDKPATTAVTVRDAARGFAPGDSLYVEFNAAVDFARCGGTDTAPLWCGPVFVTRGVATSPAMEGFRK